MPFGVVDAFIAQGVVLLLLGFLLFAASNEAETWSASVLFSRLGWASEGLAAASFIAAAWVAALT